MTAMPIRAHSGFPRRPGGGAGGPASPGGGPSGGTPGGVDDEVVESAGGVGPSGVGGVGILIVGLSSAISAQSLRGRLANAGPRADAPRLAVVHRRTELQEPDRYGGDTCGQRWQTLDAIGPRDRGGLREVRAHRGPPDPAPSPGRTSAVGLPFVRRPIRRRPGRKERHALGRYRRPVDVSRLPQGHGRPRGHRPPHPRTAAPAPADAATDYILMSRSALLAAPRQRHAMAEPQGRRRRESRQRRTCATSTPEHHLRTLAAALVYARTGTRLVRHQGAQRRHGRHPDPARRLRQRDARARPAADGLRPRRRLRRASPAAPIRRSGRGSRTIRRKVIGGHGIWNSLYRTHLRSRRPTGAPTPVRRESPRACISATAPTFAAAAASLAASSATAARTAFWDKLSTASMSWACSPTNYTPVNGWCRRGGILVDGAVVADIGRGGYRRVAARRHRHPVPARVDPGPRPAGRAALPERLLVGLALVQPCAQADGHGRHPLEGRPVAPAGTRRRRHARCRGCSTAGCGMSISRASYSGMGRAIGFTDWLWG